MICNVVVLVLCLILLSEISQSTLVKESKPDDSEFVRVFNRSNDINLWNEMELGNSTKMRECKKKKMGFFTNATWNSLAGAGDPYFDECKKKKMGFFTNATWNSLAGAGDPYFDGFMNHTEKKDAEKISFFETIKNILEKKNPIKKKDHIYKKVEADKPGHWKALHIPMQSSVAPFQTTSNSILMKEKDTKSEPEKNDKIISSEEINSTSVDNDKYNGSKNSEQAENVLDKNEKYSNLSELAEQLKVVGQRLEFAGEKIEDELKRLHKIRTSMEKAACESRAVKILKSNKKWEDWSAWSACSVTCGAGIQIRDRITKAPERGRPTIELEIKSCRLPDCNPASQLLCSANNILKTLILSKNNTHYSKLD